MPTIAEQFIEKGRIQGRMEGIEQGIEKGIGQGIEQGKIRQCREMIEMMVESRVGRVDERVSERLTQIEDLNMLKNLFKQLASVTTQRRGISSAGDLVDEFILRIG